MAQELIQVAYPSVSTMSAEQARQWALDILSNDFDEVRSPDQIALQEALQIINDSGKGTVSLLDADESGRTEYPDNDQSLDSDPFEVD